MASEYRANEKIKHVKKIKQTKSESSKAKFLAGAVVLDGMIEPALAEKIKVPNPGIGKMRGLTAHIQRMNERRARAQYAKMEMREER